MDIVLREIGRLNHLVNDFLLFARPKQAKIERFELNQLIVESLALFKYREQAMEGIQEERRKMASLKAMADTVIDSTFLNVHQLKDAVQRAYLPPTTTRRIILHVQSFGYRYGLPADADIVVPGPYGVGWYENTGGFAFVYHSIGSPGGYACDVDDVDQDGDMDVVVAQQLAWWRNNGAMGFTRVPIASGKWWRVKLGDLNNDGIVTVLEMFALAKAGIDTTWNVAWKNTDYIFSPHVSGGPIDLVLF